MFGTMAGGENPGPVRPEKNWAQCLVDDRRVFRATEGSTEKRLLGVWGRNGAMAHGGKEGWEVVSGSRRSGGMFYDEVAQGRGGEQLATPHNTGRQEL